MAEYLYRLTNKFDPSSTRVPAVKLTNNEIATTQEIGGIDRKIAELQEEIKRLGAWRKEAAANRCTHEVFVDRHGTTALDGRHCAVCGQYFGGNDYAWKAAKKVKEVVPPTKATTRAPTRHYTVYFMWNGVASCVTARTKKFAPKEGCSKEEGQQFFQRWLGTAEYKSHELEDIRP